MLVRTVNTDEEIRLLQISHDSVSLEKPNLWFGNGSKPTYTLEKEICFMSSDAWISEAQVAPWILT